MKKQKLILLIKRQWLENRRTYLFSFAAMSTIFLLFFIITWHFRNSFSGDTNKGIFLLGLFIGGSLFTTSLLRDLGNHSRMIWLIGLPASVAEKLVVILFFSIPCFLGVFLASFYLVETLFNLYIRAGTMTDLLKNDFYKFIFTYVNLQLFMIIGCLYFRKLAFLKTTVCVIVAFIAGNYLHLQLLALLTGETQINGGSLFHYFQFSYQEDNVYVHLPAWQNTFISIFFNWFVPVITTVTGYFKIKEIELS